MRQINIGNKNHNIPRYIRLAEFLHREGVNLPNSEFEKLNYN